MSKKTYIITGHYGSGKTEFSLNLALKLSKQNEKITIADLDSVNPYFRTREKQDFLIQNNIHLVGSSLNNHTGQDIPALDFSFASNIKNDEYVIVDLGGEDVGARVISSFKDSLCGNDYNFLCVLNSFRAETNTSDKMINFIHKINTATLLKISGIVNNGHMLHYTTKDDILACQYEIEKVSKELNIPILYTQIRSDIYEQIKEKIISKHIITFETLKIRENWQ
ncbi:MAG: ATP-binding protein [Defluviitaleaceae bacterium]|nr:ATP-binding protein [Defluviitaleaceae bacterium]